MKAAHGDNIAVVEGSFTTILGLTVMGRNSLMQQAESDALAAGAKTLLLRMAETPGRACGTESRRVVCHRTPCCHSVAKSIAGRTCMEPVGFARFDSAFQPFLTSGLELRLPAIVNSQIGSVPILIDETDRESEGWTRHRIEADFVHLWHKHRFTVAVMGDSSVQAVLLSERVVVHSPLTGEVADIITIDEPYPRGTEYFRSQKFTRSLRQVQIAAGLDAGARLRRGLKACRQTDATQQHSI